MKKKRLIFFDLNFYIKKSNGFICGKFGEKYLKFQHLKVR